MKTKENLIPPLWILTLIAAFAVIWVLLKLKEIVVILVIGYCLAYLIQPLLDKFHRRGISRQSGFFVLCGVAVIVLVLLAFTAVPTIVDEYSELSKNLPSYVETARDKLFPLYDKARSTLLRRGSGAVVPIKPASPGDLLPPLNADMLNSVLSGVGGVLLRGYSITLTVINILLLPFIVYYLSLDFRGFHSRLLALFPLKRQMDILNVVRDIDKYVSAFVRGQITVCTLLFCLYLVGLGILGVKLWFLLAVITGFGNIIPYIGTLTGFVLCSLMALVTFGDVSHLLLVWGLFAIIQLLESTVISPRVLGEHTGLSPLVVILAVVAGGQLFGLVGVFLAVPGAAVLRVLSSYLHAWLLKHAALQATS